MGIRRAAALTVLVLAAAAGYLLGLWAVSQLHTAYPALRPFLMTGGGFADASEWMLVAMTPLGLLGVLLGGLLIDVSVLGYDRSALRRLVHPSASGKVDLFYVLLRLSGGVQVLAFVFTLGTVYYAANALHARFAIGLLTGRPLLVQFAVVYVVNSFIFYAAHRLMHTRWLWPIHKVHHAAAEMNLVTSVRNHPIDFALMTLLYALPAAVLGADVRVLLAYYAVNGVYQALVHSELRCSSPLLDAVWITPDAHRIHHSNRSEHWNRNFGILTVWDKAFGTYHPPADGPLTYGVDGDDTLNRDERLREVFALVWRWMTRRA